MKPRHVQATILNMYLHQMRCIDQIQAYEQIENFTFDYVISTREDIIFFYPLNLTYALWRLEERKFITGDNASRLSELPRKCHMVMKDCANFKGFNQRFFIYERQTAINLLSNRWLYYQQLVQTKKVLFNTEVFEMMMARHYQAIGCPLPIDHFAVTAVRPVKNDIFCFPFWEVFKCLPSGYKLPMHDKCEHYLPAKHKNHTIHNTVVGESHQGNASSVKLASQLRI
jgi:hypothetical protein